MNRLPAAGLVPNLLMAAVLGTVVLASCQKREEAEVTTAPPPPAATPAPLPSTQAASPASVTGVAVGNAIGADKRVSTPTSTFAAKDTIYVAIDTSTGNPAASVPATLGVKWTHVDSNQTVHDESRGVTLSGTGTTEFHLAKPGGWPPGRYRAEVSLDGRTVQTREFEVR